MAVRNVKLANGLLWVLNALLGAGIVVFAFQYLIFPQDSGLLRGFDPGSVATARPIDRPAPQVSDEVLKKLRNPLEKTASKDPVPTVASSFRAALTGVMTGDDPSRGVAFLRLTARNTEFVAFANEPIFYDGKPVDELVGWKLAEVHKDKAVFTNGKERQVVALESEAKGGGAGRPAGPGAPGGPGGARVQRAGQPYQAGSFRTQLLSSDERQQVWAVDPQEMDWLGQNQERVLDQDFQVSPMPGGGLRVESVQSGSIGSTRGISAGDVVKSVNGIPLNSLADLKSLANNPSLRNQSAVRLTVERAGKVMVLVYQPLRP
jgi:hypothetical protein